MTASDHATRAPGDATDDRDVVRVAIMLNHPVQHFARGFQLLASDPRVVLRVYFWNAAADGLFDPGFGRHVRWDVDLRGGYDWWAPPQIMRMRRAAAVLRQLRRDRPHVILCHGWASPITRLGILFSRTSGTPLVYYGDTNQRAVAERRHARLHTLAHRAVMRTASAALTIGVANRGFYLAHGLRPDQIHRGVLPVDVESFAAAAAGRWARDHEAGTRHPLVIGYVGKLKAIKAVDNLVEAAASLPRGRGWELWLVGDGSQRHQLEALTAGCGLSDRVRFLGFKNTSEIPSLMAAMDILVLPSIREPRGLVAVEAMAAGTAVVVSSATGIWGCGDLVEHDETGLVFPAGDIAALGACLRRLIDDFSLRRRLADAGQARALTCGPRDYAATAAAALLSTARKQDLGALGDHHALPI